MYRKTLSILAISLLPLAAQAFPPPHEGPESAKHQQRHLNHMEEELDLNDQQKQQVGDLFKQQAEKFKAIHDETESHLQQILSPEQFQKLQTLKQEKREHFKQRRHPDDTPAR